MKNKFATKVEYVEAEQWFPGSNIEGVITDPKALIGMPGAHIGHQRELEGGDVGLLKTNNGLEFVFETDFIVTDEAGKVSVMRCEDFENKFNLI